MLRKTYRPEGQSLFFKQLAPHKATAWLETQFCLSLKIKTSTILEYVEMNILMFSFAVLLASRILFGIVEGEFVLYICFLQI